MPPRIRTQPGQLRGIVGSETSASTSDCIISGLTPGTQHWMRLRPVRGADVAEWSDRASRVAPIWRRELCFSWGMANKLLRITEATSAIHSCHRSSGETAGQGARGACDGNDTNGECG